MENTLNNNEEPSSSSAEIPPLETSSPFTENPLLAGIPPLTPPLESSVTGNPSHLLGTLSSTSSSGAVIPTHLLPPLEFTFPTTAPLFSSTDVASSSRPVIPPLGTSFAVTGNPPHLLGTLSSTSSSGAVISTHLLPPLEFTFPTTAPLFSSGASSSRPVIPLPHLPGASGNVILQQQEQEIRSFLRDQAQQIENVTNFKNNEFPLARIKNIMKADREVRTVALEVPILFSKACELFVLELTKRSWFEAIENGRRKLEGSDIKETLRSGDLYDFLADIVPGCERTEERVLDGMVVPTVSGVPLNNPPMGHPTDTGGMMIHMPPLDTSGLYLQPPPPPPPLHPASATGDDVSHGGGGSSSQGNLDGQGNHDGEGSEFPG